MVSSLFAGIPFSSSISTRRNAPVLTRGQQTKRAPKGPQVAGFSSEWWPASSRNAGRHQIGIPGRIASEFAYPDLESLEAHVLAFITAYNFSKHLKALR
jgi:hypothetical protein